MPLTDPCSATALISRLLVFVTAVIVCTSLGSVTVADFGGTTQSESAAMAGTTQTRPRRDALPLGTRELPLLREARGSGGARSLSREAELGVDVREVSLDGADAEEQPPRDLLVAAPGRDELEHLAFARAQVELGRSSRLGGAEEGADLVEEHRPRRLVGEQDVVAAFERDEASA